jgi:acid stress-induced BolA-like protein IbaG/YrbA
MQTTEVMAMIKQQLPTAIVDVVSDDGVHFTAVIVANEFTNMSQVKRQQLVYATVAEPIRTGRLHALSLKTYTPTEWAEK